MPHQAYSVFSIPDTAAEVLHVMPIFYGMLGFASAAANASALRAVRTVSSSNAFIRCWAVTDAAGGGATRVVLIHKDPTASASAAITISPPGGARLAGDASLVRGLPGGAGMSSAWDGGLSLAGWTYGATTDGSATRAPGVPESESVAPGAGGEFSFQLPPASFAILTLPAH